MVLCQLIGLGWLSLLFPVLAPEGTYEGFHFRFSEGGGTVPPIGGGEQSYPLGGWIN